MDLRALARYNAHKGMDPTAILITSSVVIMFPTLLAVSYKTGFVPYSIWSLTRGDQPRFEIQKNKIGKFLQLNAGIFTLNIVCGFIIDRKMSDMGGVLILALFNTIVIGYGLASWVLLKEKKKPKTGK